MSIIEVRTISETAKTAYDTARMISPLMTALPIALNWFRGGKKARQKLEDLQKQLIVAKSQGDKIEPEAENQFYRVASKEGHKEGVKEWLQQMVNKIFFPKQ